ncbi:MAG: hypothetical protein SGJ19_04605 [Planctomycetia bacterium]|nr:hypothetical protein [Planctomycetia bacterium]
MRRSALPLLAVMLASVLNSPLRADDKAMAILDKAIAAAGGAENLAKLKAASWKAEGTLNFGGNESEFTTSGTTAGPDKLRTEFEGNFGGNPFKAVTVIVGDKGWRNFAGMSSELDANDLANEKRNFYLSWTPVALLPLKYAAFQLESAGEEKVGDKTTDVLKITGPDKKDFKLYIDRESGLPVKQVANVIGFMGEEAEQETTYGEFKSFGDIKRSSLVEISRDGQRIIKQTVTEFKALDKVDEATFTEPK